MDFVERKSYRHTQKLIHLWVSVILNLDLYRFVLSTAHIISVVWYLSHILCTSINMYLLTLWKQLSPIIYGSDKPLTLEDSEVKYKTGMLRSCWHYWLFVLVKTSDSSWCVCNIFFFICLSRDSQTLFLVVCSYLTWHILSATRSDPTLGAYQPTVAKSQSHSQVASWGERPVRGFPVCADAESQYRWQSGTGCGYLPRNHHYNSRGPYAHDL